MTPREIWGFNYLSCSLYTDSQLANGLDDGMVK
jgi:hypothetical protein